MLFGSFRKLLNFDEIFEFSKSSLAEQILRKSDEKIKSRTYLANPPEVDLHVELVPLMSFIALGGALIESSKISVFGAVRSC